MQSDILYKLETLKNEYAKQLPLKLNEIEKQWHLISRKHADNLWPKLIHTTHTLCGTAGTYGFTMVSEVAHRLEAKLNGIDYPALSNDNIYMITNLIQDLKQVSMLLPEIEFSRSHLNPPVRVQKKQRIIYIMGSDKKAIEQQFNKLNNYNYDVTIFSDFMAMMEAIYIDKPNMILLDIGYAERITEDYVKALREEFILLIYISKQDGLEERLASVRHGGQAFMLIPSEVEIMIRSIENLFQATCKQAEKILIVDDSEHLTRYYALMLETIGMLVETVNDPRIFLQKLQEFQPDIILMDINMPYVSGTELAQVVHQQENLSSIPIIFLSTISEKSKQLETLSYAGDDFITKPIEPKHLLAVIRNRLMRSRIMRSRMIRDGLTNLYNHTMIHHQLEREIHIAERYNKILSVALIDIDHFKMVNDTYGHQAGDKILHELSNFLQTRLRISDAVGRYGGEEFLIVLPNTTITNAYNIINQLRENFANTSHVIGSTCICITFSAGVAHYPQYDNINQLIKASDEALYSAKKSGRNRVMLTTN